MQQQLHVVGNLPGNRGRVAETVLRHQVENHGLELINGNSFLLLFVHGGGCWFHCVCPELFK